MIFCTDWALRPSPPRQGLSLHQLSCHIATPEEKQILIVTSKASIDRMKETCVQSERILHDFENRK